MAKKKEILSQEERIKLAKKKGSLLSPKTFMKSIGKIEQMRNDILLKAGQSNDPDVIIKANQYLLGRLPNTRGISNPKSLFTDPLDFSSFFKYKDRPTSLSYDMLRRMARTPIIGAIIDTRIAQGTRFFEYAKSKFDIGWQIVMTDADKEPDKDDKANMKKIVDSIENSGFGGYVFGRDSFEEFGKKFLRDSITYDQGAFEVCEDKKGIPREWLAVDGTTFRMATVDEDEEGQDDLIKYYNDRPYKPAYVQLNTNGEINAYYHPWELCFGIRRPRTDLRINGYGYAELEDLVDTTTSMLWSDEYNRRFFSQGAAPKGIIRVSGEADEEKLEDFKRQWMAQISGVYNAWKTPIMQAEGMEWVNLMLSNRDMEFSKWQEYNIRLACAKFTISPSEIGFYIDSNSGGVKFEGSKEQELKYSMDKGLVPIMKSLNTWLNRYIVWRIDPRYSFKFFGTGSDDRQTTLDRVIKEVGAFRTLDEVRAVMDDKPLGEEKGGDLILNSAYIQYINAKNQAEQQQAQQEQGEQQQEGGYEDEDGYEEEGRPAAPTESDPFQKAFDDWSKENLFKDK